MGRVHVSRDLAGATAAEVEALWHAPERWPAFIDGFGAVHSIDPGWPQAGGKLVWDSRPGGRGRVIERSLAHAPGQGFESEVEDERLSGRQTVAFRELDGGIEVIYALDYRLKSASPLRWIVDQAFVARQLRDAALRTLERFARELEAERSAR